MAREALPPFAKAWAAQWKAALPALEAVRANELRALDAAAVAAANLHLQPRRLDEDRETYSGLVIQQAWFMRMRILASLGKAP